MKIPQEDKLRTAQLFKTILLTIEIGFIIYVLMVFVIQQHYERFYLLGAIVPLLVVTHVLLRQGYVHLAGIVGVWGLWFAITISAFTTGGVYSPSFFVYTVPILLAGLLIERRAGIALTGGSMLMGLILVWSGGEAGNLAASASFGSPILHWLIGSLTFSTIAVLQYVEVSALSDALTQTRRHEHALAASNQALQMRTQTLEERERALQKSEAHLRALIQALPDSIVQARSDGTILDVSVPPNFTLSMPAQQLIGRKIQESFPPDLADQLLQMNQAALATRAVQVHEYSVPVDGELYWRESRVLATSTYEIIAIVRDITQRKRAAEILHQSRERYRKLVELSPDAILVYRRQKVLFANPAGVQLWRAREVSELVGRSIEELTHPSAWNQLHAWQESLGAQGGLLPNIPHQIVRLDGTRADVEVAAAIYEDQDGPAVQAIYRDVTERKQAEAKNQQLLHQVESQRSQLRALNMRLARLEENERKRLSHELHDRVAQNLTGLNLNLNVLRRQLQQELVAESRVHPRLNDAISLVEQTTVQIRNVMSDLRPPVLDDYGLLATLEWYADQITKNTGLPVEVLGETLTPRPAEYVELTLFRIAQEALTNVVKHALATQAMVVLTADDATIYVSVSDDGVGIEQTDQAPTTKQQSWGLITMRERAEAIGGCCRIESCPFLGTEVLMEAPR